MLDQITKDITFLRDNNTSQDITGKIQAAERLSTNSYFLAAQVAEAYESMNSAEYMWKSAVTGSVVMNTGAVGRAEAEAKDKFKSLYKDYIDADSKYRKMSLLLSQTNVIIEQARQTISYLKQELRNGM